MSGPFGGVSHHEFAKALRSRRADLGRARVAGHDVLDCAGHLVARPLVAVSIITYSFLKRYLSERAVPTAKPSQ
jgi:hypothetical protein